MSFFSMIKKAIVSNNIREVHHLVRMRSKSPRIFKLFFSTLIRAYGFDLPLSVKIGKNVVFAHNCMGSVILENTVLEDSVILFHNVTLARRDVYLRKSKDSLPPAKFVIKEYAMICTGAILLCPDDYTFVVGRNSVVGAGSVLTHSIGDNEMWVGNPARLVKRWNGQEWVKA